MRKYYWYLTAFLRKHGIWMIASVIFAIIFFSLLIPIIARRIDAKQRMYIGVVGEFTLTSLPPSIQNLISFGLTKIDEDGSVSPGAASRWIVEDDGKTYRFVVRDDLIWQDGKPLTTDDITYDFSDAETITTQNDIVFKLSDIFVPFPTVVSQPLFRFTEQPYLFFFTKPKVVGLGEYTVLDFERQKQQLQRSERLKELILDNPQERRIYRFYQTEKQAVDAFKRGEVDILTDLTSQHDIGDWPTTKVTQKLHPERYLAVFFDLNKPLFQKNIRQALSYSLKKPQDKTRAIGPINPDSWTYLSGAKSYEYDLDRAIERILSSLPQQKLEFTLTTTNSFASMADAIKKEWETFGQQAFEACQKDDDVEDKNLCDNAQIKVHIRISNFPDTSDFDALLIGMESPPDPDQYYLWHSDQTTNFADYKNTRIDSLLERGRQVADKQERKAIYQEFQQFLLEDAPAIFLEHLTSYDIQRK